MCFSSAASFAIALPLIAGGAWSISTAVKNDPRYLPLAVMPLAVGIQQFIEGIVWAEVGQSDMTAAHTAAMFYMLFVWVFWPSWVPFMTANLEPDKQRKTFQLKWTVVGLVFGLMLYVPYFYHPDWVNPYIAGQCMTYNTVVLPDFIVPRTATAIIYLAIIGLIPLTSSYAAIRYFGWSLLLLVPLTYFFFLEAYLSVLCFFAAIVTTYIIMIIAENKCGLAAPKSKIAFKPVSSTNA